ncbi:MAG: hypothetical protein FJ292_10260 [Planctomycetes bacterium]|nr:hypothetical protein [Planctomycetota bacterium]
MQMIQIRSYVWAIICTVLLATTLLTRTASGDDRADRRKLLDGVTEVAAPGWTGQLCVFGDGAFAVVTGDAGSETRLPAVAAARLGKGRMVGFAHNGYFDKTQLATADTTRLLLNAVRWAAHKDRPRIAVHAAPHMLTMLRQNGLEAENVDGVSWERNLDSFDALVSLETGDYDQAQTVAIEQFVRRGGGFLAAECPWGWLSIFPTKSLTSDLGANRLFLKGGMMFTRDGLNRTSPQGFSTAVESSPLINASRALKVLQGQDGTNTGLSQADLRQASASIVQAAQSLPQDDTMLRPSLERVRERFANTPLIRPGKPLGADQALERVALTLEVQRLQEAPVDQIRAHPSATVFPGSVSATAPRVTRTVALDTGVPRWHSTGLYAAPGALITVKVPDSAIQEGLSVRIGCHTDALWHLDSWERAPEISRAFKIESSVSKVANAFGGLVYLEVPDGCRLGTIDVTIEGAVEAPLFVLGKTSPEDWRRSIRNRPGPWAELASDRLIVTVPSESVRALADPTALMQFWCRVTDLDHALLSRPPKRSSPERFVPDIQISYGYMHAGYPIMMFMDAPKFLLDLDTLQRDGNWGLFHELGHNHQQDEWTFDGTVEVTCNLFSLYNHETLNQSTGIFDPELHFAKFMRHRAEGAPFDKWKSDPFLALTMYHQLRQGFGWSAYKQVFAAYDQLPSDQRPKSDDEKRDLWMVLFSRTVGRNLGPFFEIWGVPTSQGAKDSIRHLPVWLPEGVTQ